MSEQSEMITSGKSSDLVGRMVAVQLVKPCVIPIQQGGSGDITFPVQRAPDGREMIVPFPIMKGECLGISAHFVVIHFEFKQGGVCQKVIYAIPMSNVTVVSEIVQYPEPSGIVIPGAGIR